MILLPGDCKGRAGQPRGAAGGSHQGKMQIHINPLRHTVAQIIKKTAKNQNFHIDVVLGFTVFLY